MGIRHGFGLFLQPVSIEMGWGREIFALALAVQNLTWGATQPFAGFVADRFGSARVIVVGRGLYVLGLVTMSLSSSPWLFVLTAGVLIGVGQSGVTYSVVSGVLGRKVPAREAQHGARHFRRGGFLRTVRDAAVHAVDAHEPRLARRRCSRSPPWRS